MYVHVQPAQRARSPTSETDDWLIDGNIERQGTDSTMASEIDGRIYKNQFNEPLLKTLAYTPRPSPGSLEGIREKRGWKYFFRYTVPIPITFVAGIAIGILVAYLFLPMRLAIAQEPYKLIPPPIEVPSSYWNSKPLNNSCLIPRLNFPNVGKPQTFDACGFVIRSTDELWNLRSDVDAAIEKYFHEDYVDAGSWGKRIIGKNALREAVLSQMRAFPDIRIHITDCVCRGNDMDGYKCAMPDVLTGTNLGPSAYGPATGNPAKWTGLVQSFVKRNPVKGQWQYYAEWGVHDEWALIQQLGLDFSRIPHASMDIENVHDCFPLLEFTKDGASINRMDAADMMAHKPE